LNSLAIPSDAGICEKRFYQRLVVNDSWPFRDINPSTFLMSLLASDFVLVFRQDLGQGECAGTAAGAEVAPATMAASQRTLAGRGLIEASNPST
jgi:hypothetical protein